MSKIDATMQEMVLAYLRQSYEQLETDGFLTAQDVTFPQATDLLNDFVIFVHAYGDAAKPKTLSTEVDDSVEEQISDLLKDHLDDLAIADEEGHNQATEGDYAAHEYKA